MLASKVGSAVAENRKAEKGTFPLDSNGRNSSPGSEHAGPRCGADQAANTCLFVGPRMWVHMGGVEREFSDLVLVPTSIIALNCLSYDL